MKRKDWSMSSSTKDALVLWGFVTIMVIAAVVAIVSSCYAVTHWPD